MKTNESFKNRLVGLQGNLLSFAYQLTSNLSKLKTFFRTPLLKRLIMKRNMLTMSTSKDGSSQ